MNGTDVTGMSGHYEDITVMRSVCMDTGRLLAYSVMEIAAGTVMSVL